MIFMGYWRPEQREYAIASRLDNIAVVAVRRVYHQLKCRIYDRTPLLGVEVLHQLHRTLHVSEQRGDRFAFALGIFRGWCVGDSNQLIIRFLSRRSWSLRKPSGA